MITPARELAFRTLMAVEGGAFASDLLAANSVSLSSRDAGLAAAITLGVLRYRSQIDFLIEKLTGKTLKKLDPEVRQALRVGVFQLRYLDRIPAHAAVGESVELVKRHGKRSAAGLVNAVLRKAAGITDDHWPDRQTALSCPEWLLVRWTRAFGERIADRIAAAALATPLRYLHIPPGSSVPENAIPTEVPGCFELSSGREVPPGARIQDIGSQQVGSLLTADPGHRVLDLCAAPGNKTAQIRESGAWTVAADSSERRLGMVPPPRVVLDARHPLPFGFVFDRILVDAPCSGTGTLAHNPEIKWRLTDADIAGHAERQQAILREALRVLAPGGVLVYSTCSLELEENENVVAAVAGERVVQTLRRMPGRDAGDGFYAAVLR